MTTGPTGERLWLLVAVLGLMSAAAVLWWNPPAGDDAYHHGIGAVEQVRAWKLGDPWPRFHRDMNGGTGSFLPSVYSQLVMSLDGLLCWLVGEGTRAIAISMLTALLAGAVVLRGFVEARERPLVVSWLLLPYPLAALTARATVTESWGLAASCGVLVLAFPPGPRGRVECFLAAFCTMIVCGTQLVMLPLIVMILVAGWLSQGVRAVLREAPRTAAWICAGAMMGAPFWLPAVAHARHLDLQGLSTGAYGWRNHMIPSWHRGGELDLFLTVVASVLAVVAAGALTSGAVRRDVRSRALAVGTLVGVLMATPVSGPLWSTGWLDILQFPWRFLGPASITGLLLATRLAHRREIALALLLFPLLFLPVELDGGSPPLDPAMTRERLSRAAGARYGMASVLPSMPGMYAPGFHPVGSLRTLDAQAAELVLVNERASGRSYDVAVFTAGPVSVPTQWWPEWRIEVDGTPLHFTRSNGLLQLNLEEGRHHLRLTLARCPARATGVVLGGVGLTIIVLLLWRWGGAARAFRPVAGGAYPQSSTTGRCFLGGIHHALFCVPGALPAPGSSCRCGA